ECDTQTYGGAVAVQLRIPSRSVYRIETTRAWPNDSLGGDSNVFIRTNCAHPTSQIACGDDIDPTLNTSFIDNYLASITVTLDPGDYTVIASGYWETPT